MTAMAKLSSQAFLPTGAGGFDSAKSTGSPATTGTSPNTQKMQQQQPPQLYPPHPHASATTSTTAFPNGNGNISSSAAASPHFPYQLHIPASASAPLQYSSPLFDTTRLSPSLHLNGRGAHLSPPLPRSQHHKTHMQARSPPAVTSTTTTTNLDSNGAVGVSLSRSVSADAAAPTAAGPQHVSIQFAQRLVQQNALIREAWEAERNYLEANRRRAEEVYQEERAIMEEVREAWEREKVVMMQEIQALKERIQRLEGENSTLRAVAAQSVQAHGVIPSTTAIRSDSSARGSPVGLVELPSSHSSDVNSKSSPPIQLRQSAAESAMLPPGLDGASRRPHFVGPAGARVSPSTQPESSPFVPLDPRMQPRKPSTRDFLAPTIVEDDSACRVVDVHEIDPNLEGILLKSTAVERSTFSDTDDTKSSSANSPPLNEVQRDESAQESTPTKKSSKDHTLQVLAAEESKRRTMHAGHTPNHSLSLFPTMKAADDSVTTSAKSDAVTPTADLERVPEETAEVERSKPTNDVQPQTVEHSQKPAKQEPAAEPANEDPPEQLEPKDDARMKGPLMIRNIPAQDEIFWAALNQKLEPISQGQGALPSALRVELEDLESAAGPSGLAQAAQRHVSALGGDASHDAQAQAEEHDGKSPPVNPDGGVEGNIPLKLKSTTNFGAPFGVA